jgi:SAM-dependent methyltransferase
MVKPKERPMSDANSQYWLARDGRKYQAQQGQRTEGGNPIYAQQERWLVTYFHEIGRVLGRPVRVLEFGCGFGRFARLFAKDPLVVYHGYDFSASMLQPLFDEPPAGLDMSQVRVAATVEKAFADQAFDVVFTVSVLIHNPPDKALELKQRMLRLLAPGGQLCLMENQLASFSMRENNWHGGCWVHDHVGPHAEAVDITIYRDVVADQDIYVYREPAGAPMIHLSRADQKMQVATREEIRLLGLARLEAAVRGIEGEVQQFAAQQAVFHDAREDLVDLQRSLGVADARIRALEEKVASSEALRTQLEDCQSLRLKVSRALMGHEADDHPGVTEAELTDKEHLIVPVAPPSRETFLWDAPRDTELAHECKELDAVCHVFHLEWFGMRAAAGALPGRKLGISSEDRLDAPSIDRILALLRYHAVSRLVVHGFSANTEAFIRAMRAAGFEHIYLVWHGAPAMWVFKGECELAQRALALVKRGIVRRMHGMRRGMDEVIGKSAYAPQLLNVAPNVPPTLLPRDRPSGGAIVFSPSWNLLHKNVISNLLAAQIHPKVRQFWTMARDTGLTRDLSSKVKTLSSRSGKEMLETMRQADLIMNVSIVDCHPMVDQEALAVGTPCLRGPLFLDALEDHPYVRLTEVSNPLSVHDISSGISRVLNVAADELDELMRDYSRRIRAVSFARYLDFVELG